MSLALPPALAWDAPTGTSLGQHHLPAPASTPGSGPTSPPCGVVGDRPPAATPGPHVESTGHSDSRVWFALRNPREAGAVWFPAGPPQGAGHLQGLSHVKGAKVGPGDQDAPDALQSPTPCPGTGLCKTDPRGVEKGCVGSCHPKALGAFCPNVLTTCPCPARGCPSLPQGLLRLHQGPCSVLGGRPRKLFPPQWRGPDPAAETGAGPRVSPAGSGPRRDRKARPQAVPRRFPTHPSAFVGF